MEITLTPDIEQALVEQARRRRTTPQELALESLRQHFVYPASSQTVEGHGTLADFLADSIGVLQSGEYVPGGAGLSEATGEMFAKALIEKREQGSL